MGAAKTQWLEAMHNAALTDFENWCLANRWVGEPPRGKGLVNHTAWRRMMRAECKESDHSWKTYKNWVLEGGGDDWFREDTEITEIADGRR